MRTTSQVRGNPGHGVSLVKNDKKTNTTSWCDFPCFSYTAFYANATVGLKLDTINILLLVRLFSRERLVWSLRTTLRDCWGAIKSNPFTIPWTSRRIPKLRFSRCLIGMFLGVPRHTEPQFRDGPGYLPGMVFRVKPGLQVSFISHES